MPDRPYDLSRPRPRPDGRPAFRARCARLRGTVLVSAAILASLPGVAAAGTDRSTDARALSAYHEYLQALVSGETAAADRAQLIVDGVSRQCPRALADLDRLSSDQLRRSALSAYGTEIDAAVTLAYLTNAHPALGHFRDAVAGLPWRSTGPRRSTARFLGSEDALMRLPGPSLCDDARTLDAAPQSEPTSTQHFLTRYSRLTAAAASGLAGFRSVLERWQTPSEALTVAGIDGLAGSYASASASTVTADAADILSALGVPGTGAQQRSHR